MSPSSSSSSSPKLSSSSSNAIFPEFLFAFFCLCTFTTRGFAAMFKSEACVLSPSPFVHLNCGTEFVKIKSAFYSTVCGDHGCKVARDDVECEPDISSECWVLVKQFPLVECGNYYSLYLEINYECVKDPLDIKKPSSSSSSSPSPGMLTTSISIDNSSISHYDMMNPESDESTGNHSAAVPESSNEFDRPSETNLTLTSEVPPLNTSLTPVTAMLHRGPTENELSNENEDVRKTTASRPISPANNDNGLAPSTALPPNRKRTRRPLWNDNGGANDAGGGGGNAIKKALIATVFASFILFT